MNYIFILKLQNEQYWVGRHWKFNLSWLNAMFNRHSEYNMPAVIKQNPVVALIGIKAEPDTGIADELVKQMYDELVAQYGDNNVHTNRCDAVASEVQTTRRSEAAGCSSLSSASSSSSDVNPLLDMMQRLQTNVD